ncbi:MAG: hypothetical protein LAP13_09945 [Acidobacteriia bacterium]|nr:hypothetical protein [Terriglobia bacterium]
MPEPHWLEYLPSNQARLGFRRRIRPELFGEQRHQLTVSVSLKGECVMRKTITLEIAVSVDESVEQRAIQVAREHYSKAGGSRVRLDHKGERWREALPEEFIPDTVSAMIELIGANHLLEDAGVEVTAVSAREGGRGETQPQLVGEAELQEAPSLRGRTGEGSEADLDEFETGAYLCRWPNGDFSLVTANTRREALVQLDEWDVAHPSQLFPLEPCMVDFRLNDLGEIELKQFGEESEDLIWEISYPELHALLSQVVPRDGTEDTAEVKESIRQAVQHERTRLWKNQPESPPAETETGRTLQKRLGTAGPVADYYVQEMANRILRSKDDKGGRPN